MDFLINNELLALTAVMAVGLALGRIKIFGLRLGAAAVLFVGLGLSTIEPEISIPAIVYVIGLALFVYAIGLASGPAFFSSLKKTGLRNNALALSVIFLTAVATFGLVKLFGINASAGAGAFTGAMTNTPAMAAVVDTLPSLIKDTEQLHIVSEIPVISYSLAYPLGVLIVIVSVALGAKIFNIDHRKEAEEAGVAEQALYSHLLKITHPNPPSVFDIPKVLGVEVIISRVERNGVQFVPGAGERLDVGDIVTIVGPQADLEVAQHELGEIIEGNPYHDGSLDYRRIFVSSPEVVGIPLRVLSRMKPGMLITRVRRGDDDLVASSDMTLQLGDRVRVVAEHDQIKNLTKFFGDSYKRLSDVNLLPLVLGLVLGILLGMVAIPLPGGAALKLGNAGGPLVVGLILGAMTRTGKFLWQIPYGASLTIQQLGMTLFLAAIGTTAGAGFRQALSDPSSLSIIAAGAIITLIVSLFTLVLGYKVFKIPFGEVSGILAGTQTQPAVLSYVSESARNELPARGYTSVYPISMIGKIIAAQMLVFLLI
ncbi:transporter [Corynebacterium poyangense]|uniref:Transporter n=1 Tax=Corynebacterium poyangense TaxID=2684405 RepID=A0A7H0SSE6_9CORY|nr:aspartate:alanine exchanger family transporter [Corynebacterium poyangense]MBZ8178478.1 transporter [Corynebacterium poyangense]QNQ91471.1 transporter [Corynebacterium poyangense]